MGHWPKKKRRVITVLTDLVIVVDIKYYRVQKSSLVHGPEQRKSKRENMHGASSRVNNNVRCCCCCFDVFPFLFSRRPLCVSVLWR